ncbi:MAG: hypothetical protein JJE09_14095 [Bacteroidia bacterium]|nr:hypothetical protein [Bacteroidia bacterium]
MVKRLVAIGLLFSFLVSFTEFSEVLRLPLLIEHFTEHKSKVDDLSFWQFLVMHYETDVAHDDQDMSLPFKDCNHSLTAQTVSLPSQKITLTELLEKTSIIHTSFYLLHEPKLLAGDIFQPPKL